MAAAFVDYMDVDAAFLAGWRLGDIYHSFSYRSYSVLSPLFSKLHSGKTTTSNVSRLALLPRWTFAVSDGARRVGLD